MKIAQFDQMSCFASHTVVPESACIPAPDSLPMEIAAFIGCCTTTGVGAVLYNAKVEANSTVAVVGCGGVGLNVIMGSGLANARQIIAVDINEGKLEFAMKFGATHSVNPSQQDAVERVKELTGGQGVDYAFEVFGSPDTVEMTYEMTKKGRHSRRGWHLALGHESAYRPRGPGTGREGAQGLLLRLRPYEHRYAQAHRHVPGGQTASG